MDELTPAVTVRTETLLAKQRLVCYKALEGIEYLLDSYVSRDDVSIPADQCSYLTVLAAVARASDPNEEGYD